MKIITSLFVFICCFSLTTLSAQLFKAKQEVINTNCNKPYNERPTIGVANIENKVYRSYTRQTTSSMYDMMINAMTETGCFKMVERTNIESLLTEQNRSIDGTVDGATAAQMGKMLGAQYMVISSLTEFKEIESGGGLFAGTGGGLLWTAHIGLIVRIVNTTTGEIVASKSINKKVRKIGVGALLRLLDVNVGTAFFKSKAMGDAIEKTIIEAVEIISAEVDGHLTQRPNTTFAAKGMMASSTANCIPDLNGKIPSVMVIIPEEHIRRRVPDPAGETEIIRKLTNLGFRVIDPKQIATLKSRTEMVAATKNPVMAVALAKEFDADIIITGEAFSEFANNNNNRFTCRARVEARAIETATGNILIAHGEHATGTDISELIAGKAALRNAGGKIAAYFLTKLCQTNALNTMGVATKVNQFLGTKEGMTTVTTSKIEVFLTNVNFLQVRQLEQMLKKDAKITNLEKSIAATNAKLEINTTGTADDIAALMLTPTIGLNWNIVGFEGQKITAELVQ